MPSPASFSVCRSCLRTISSPSKAKTHRQFSSTPSRLKHGSLPTFTETSSPELSALLSTFRSNIFLPAHLLALQRNLIYRPKNIPLLTNPDEPATVRIGKEVLPLKPLNHLKDEPDTRKSVARILALMKTGQDWSNLPRFLEGLKTAKRKLGAQMWEKIVRRAGMEGRLGIVMECARRVEATGLGMGQVGVVREVMLVIVDGVNSACDHEQKRGWTDAPTLNAAAQMVTAVWSMTGETPHIKTRKDDSSSADPRRAPEIVGIVLQTLAARALAQNSSPSPIDLAEIERFADRLLKLWSEQTKSPKLQPTAPPTTKSKNNNIQPVPAANATLLTHAPIWHALQLSKSLFQQPDQRDLLRRLSDMQDEVEGVIRDAVAIVEEVEGARRDSGGSGESGGSIKGMGKGRGWQMWEALRAAV